jgi:hypothetical protein
MIPESAKIKPNKNESFGAIWKSMEAFRDDFDKTNPTSAANPQNLNYQKRVYNKIKLFEKQMRNNR